MEEKRYLKKKEKAYSDGNREQLAIACNHLGDFYNEQGKYEEAAREYQQEAEIYQNMGKILEMAIAHRMIGEMFMLLCKFDNAKEHINIYLKTAKKLHNKVEEQRAYATLGRAHLLHGQSASDTSAAIAMEQLTQAEKAFLRSLLLVKELSKQICKSEQLDMQARCYLNIGVVKEHMENFEESIGYIEKAIKISKSNELYELTHLCYISMSLLYHCKKNDATSALRFCNLALEVAKRLPNKVQKICETLITKSEILIKVGDFASAKQILTKAFKKNTPNESDRATIEKMLRIVVTVCRTLDALVTINSDDYAECKVLYERLGDACCQLQNYSRALEYYEKMLDCAEKKGESGKDLAPIYVSLYQTYKDNKQYDKALEFLWKEYEINKDIPKEAFTTLCSIGEVCETENQSFWTINDIYQRAKSQVDHIECEDKRKKLFRIIYARLKKLCVKHKMTTIMEEMDQEAQSKGIDVRNLEKIDDDDDDDDSDIDSEDTGHEQNTPDIGADICLEDLTDSDTSDLDETEKQRPHRATRGTRALAIKRNNKGETQLHQACIAGNLELVRRLIEQGHVVNVRDHAGWLPLHEACNHGFRNIVELLLERGASAAINDKGGTSCDGITPLYDACANGFLDVVELLVERGADVTVKTDFGETCVDGLDKWRRSAKLTTGEQAHYAQVRTMLLRPLSKTGLYKNQSQKPLTNAHIEEQMEDSESIISGGKSTDSDDSNSGKGEEEDSALVPRTEQNRGKWNYSKKNSPRNLNAGAEYRNVMQQLKHPNRPQFMDDDDLRANNQENSQYRSIGLKQKRAALLNTNEVDDDSWLINDLAPDKKRRRFYSHSNIASAPASAASDFRRKSNSKENLHDSAYTTGDSTTTTTNSYALSPETPLANSPCDLTDTQSVNFLPCTNIQARQKKQTSSKLGLSRLSIGSGSSLAAKSRRHQASLLDSGFCRFRSVSPNIDNEPSSVYGSSNSANVSAFSLHHIAEPDSTTTSMQSLISPSKSASSPVKTQITPSQLPNTVSFKIKVEDELLLVPVERRKLNDANMRWLAEEAARRYYNLIGLKPMLRLKTPDGFAYEDNDSLNVALEQTMILASVLEWKIAPLPQRYEEMCHQLNSAIDNGIQCALEKTQLSNNLQLDGLWLQAHQTEPLFKALLHQTNLRVLDLSNNFIQNEGCRQLAKSLPTLKQLRSLNLKGNLITCEGLEALFSGGRNVCVQLNELHELNLSQNPLGSNCLKILDRLCDKSFQLMDSGRSNGNEIGIKANALQSLSLSQCGITEIYDFDVNYHYLEHFDISFNPLSLESLRKLLNKLSCFRLQSLNLGYVHQDSCNSGDYSIDATASLYADAVVEFFESGICEKLKQLMLCGCNLNDSNIFRILQCLNKATALDSIDLSDNPKLTMNSLQFIIKEVPQLRKLIATNCSLLIDPERINCIENWSLMPNLMNLTISPSHTHATMMPHSDLDADNNNVAHRLKTIWNNHWGDKAKHILYDDNLILYINNKDISIV